MDPQTAQEKSIFKNPVTYIVIVVIVIALIGGYLLLQTFVKETETQGSEYKEGLAKEKVTVGVVGDLSARYPAVPFDFDSFGRNANVFEGLMIVRNGKMVPGLAESWTNPDKLTWRVKIRSGVEFHSGDKFTTEDVEYTITEVTKHYPDWMGSYGAVRIASTKIISDEIIELKTATPDATLMSWLVYMPIISKEQVKKDGLEKAVGTGPYEIVSITPVEVVFTANESYWGGKPKVQTLVFNSFKDDKALAEGLDSGKANIAYFVDATNVKSLDKAKSRVLSARVGDLTYIGFDTNKKAKYVSTKENPFNNVKVRRAILLTLDVDKITQVSDREGQTLTQFASADLIGFNPNLKRPEVDLAQAKSLLAEAGFQDGFTVTLDYFDDTKNDVSSYSKVASEIKNQLAEVGIKVELNPIADFNQFLDKTGKEKKGDSSFYEGGYTPDTFDSTDLLNGFVHTFDRNTGLGFAVSTGFSDKEIDALLDQASSTLDPTERVTIIQKAHEKVMEMLPLIPLSSRVRFYGVSNSVAFKPAPFGYIFGFELSGREKSADSQ